ncbi:unnamed protein product [Symbiodinium natans]|uniref:RNA helicase n=1 Tax=Symbiodinium natans TaxID=878477 RepID=A0A812TRX5_9DINO|nr:unnamed protein product [Symbiodinium natans]
MQAQDGRGGLSPGLASEPEAEPQEGPHVASRLGPVRAGESRSSTALYEGYVEHPALQFENDMEEQDRRRLRHGVMVLEDGGSQLPRSTWSFLESCLPSWMESILRRKQKEPTPLQATSWPLLRTNRDVVVTAEHGCGKTLAYVVPLLIRAAALRGETHELFHCLDELPWDQWRQRPPDGVVLVPVKEVAAQVRELIAPYAAAGRVIVAGGMEEPVCKHSEAEATQQREASRAGVLVLTPWQLEYQSWVLGKDEDLEVLKQDVLVVFDDADEIVKDGDDDGAQARTILELLPKRRQLAFFSTTWPPRAEQMARRHLRGDAVVVHAAFECMQNASSHCLESRFVTQHFKVLHPLAKPEQLREALALLRPQGTCMAIVFCNGEAVVEKVAEQLGEQAYAAVALHDRMPSALVAERFLELQKPSVLVATTMLGRGFEFPKVKWLVNYDMPTSTLEYLQRIRLAARASGPGSALTFLCQEDLLQAQELSTLLKLLGQDVPETINKAAANRLALLQRTDPEEALKDERRNRHSGFFARRGGNWNGGRRGVGIGPRMDNVPMNLDGSWKDYHPLTVEEAADTTDLQNRQAAPAPALAIDLVEDLICLD